MNLLYFRSSKREPGRSSCGPRATRCLEEHFRLLEQLLVPIYILESQQDSIIVVIGNTPDKGQE